MGLRFLGELIAEDALYFKRHNEPAAAVEIARCVKFR